MVQRKSGHVTLLDIARACGYSVSTVSIVLSEAPLNIMSARDDSQEAHIGRSVVVRIIDQQFHFATDPRQLDRCR